MENYIRCYDNVVPDNFCDDMIKQFELSVEHHERHHQGEMSFSQLHLLGIAISQSINIGIYS